MVIFKRAGVDSLSKNLWWIANNFFFIPAILLPVAVMLLFFREDTYYFAVYWLVAGLVMFIFSSRKKRPLLIELKGDTIYYTYSTGISVVDVEMKVDQIYVKLFRNKYFTSSISASDTRHRLYFTSVKDESVYIEIGESFYTLGKILSELERSQKVPLGDKELGFVAKYRAQVEKDRTPAGRATTIAITLLILSVFGYICYRAIHNFMD